MEWYARNSFEFMKLLLTWRLVVLRL